MQKKHWASLPLTIYSADASLFVLRAGVRLIEKGISDFLYLSLTDYMQHTYAQERRGIACILRGHGYRIWKTPEAGRHGWSNCRSWHECESENRRLSQCIIY